MLLDILYTLNLHYIRCLLSFTLNIYTHVCHLKTWSLWNYWPFEGCPLLVFFMATDFTLECAPQGPITPGCRIGWVNIKAFVWWCLDMTVVTRHDRVFRGRGWITPWGHATRGRVRCQGGWLQRHLGTALNTSHFHVSLPVYVMST